MSKTLFHFVLAITLVSSSYKYSLSQSMASEITGACGNLSWVLSENGDLKISGIGEMPNYSFIQFKTGDNYPTSPWGGFKNVIFSLTIEEGVSSVGNFAFAYFENLKKVILPESITSIGESAFRNCNFSNISLSNRLTSIGADAFNRCNLQNVNITANVTEIGEGAFSGNNKLKSIEVSQQNNNYCGVDGVLFTKSKKVLIQYPAGKEDSKYKIPKTVVRIGSSAFEKSKLSEIEIPEGVAEIGVWAFSSCDKLSDIYLPKTLKKIEMYAFCWLTLKSITCLAPEVPFANHQSFDVNSDCVLNVAKGMKNEFANDTEWCRSIKIIKEKN